MLFHFKCCFGNKIVHNILSIHSISKITFSVLFEYSKVTNKKHLVSTCRFKEFFDERVFHFDLYTKILCCFSTYYIDSLKKNFF